MVLPQRHTLPLFAALFPSYGQNLVRVAQFLRSEKDSGILVIDVGANIGDSAKQIAEIVPDVKLLCIEGDPVWLPFLSENTRGVNAEIEDCFVRVRGSESLAMERSGGTTRLVNSEAGERIEFRTWSELFERHPDFLGSDLVKVDTDGYDAEIILSMLQSDHSGIGALFFEYDPRLMEAVGATDATDLWNKLESSGFDQVVIWDNFGNLLGSGDVSLGLDVANFLRESRRDRWFDYVDVLALKGGSLSRVETFVSQFERGVV